MEDPRRYVRALNFIRARIEDGSYKPHELMPPIQQLADQTGHSRHTISKALRILQDQGLVERTPGLGYVPRPAPGSAPVPAAYGHVGTSARWGHGGEFRGEQ